MILRTSTIHRLLTFALEPYTTPKPSLRNILITAALPYVNNTPHLGNIIGGVLSADVYARYCRIMNYNTFYICGTDQYGTTTQVKALSQGTTQKEICDRYHNLHYEIYQWFNISFDYFGRTTDPKHTEISQQVFKELYDNKAIAHKESQQFYCSSCEMNLADRYVKGICTNCGAMAKGDQCDECSKVYKQPTLQLKYPQCSICKSTPIIKTTEHLYLKLSEMNERMKNWTSQQNYQNMKHWSKNAQGVTKGWLNNELEDRCISRDLKWGIPIPNQYIANKVMYVWFQAPLGYISMTAMKNPEWEKWWIPEQSTKVELNQFMGKDNIMFHSIMAPSSLMSTGSNWVKPHRISATEYLMYEGGKFSKSNNFGVFGNDCAKTGICSDSWRYCLLSNRPQSFDTQFSWQNLITKNNKDLVNTVGNMCQRILKYTKIKLKGRCSLIVDSINNQKLIDLDRQFIENFYREFKEYLECLQKVELKQGSHRLIQLANIFNKYLQDSEFWSKGNIDNDRNRVVMGLSLNVLHLYGIVMSPYLPQTSNRLLKTINRMKIQTPPFQQAKIRQVYEGIVLGKYLTEHQIESILEPEILFHPIKQDKISQFAKEFGGALNK